MDHVLIASAAVTSPEDDSGVATLVIGVLFAVYLFPTIVAALRRVPNLGSIAVINIFAGFTLWGWVAALALACRHVERAPRLRVPPPAATTWPPGWYPDPHRPLQLRYFDGITWTAVVAPHLELPTPPDFG